jgi:hypothetical protein
VTIREKFLTQHKIKRYIKRKKWKKWKKLLSKEPNCKGLIRPQLFKFLKRYEGRKKCGNKDINKKLEIGIIEIPQKINFFVNDESSLIIFNKKIERYCKSTQKSIIINHKHLKSISIDGLLWLVSKIDILRNSIKLKLKIDDESILKYNEKYGINKTLDKVRYVLLESGYWEYWNISKPYSVSQSVKNDYFLKIKSNNKHLGEDIVEIRKFINSKIGFMLSLQIQNYFDDAITEAMANTCEHAYIEDIPLKMKNKWWLCGHYDTIENTLEFAFRDYGVGLRKTLEYNSNETIRSFFREIANKAKSDSDIIKMLVNDELPKYKGKRDRIRGYGFKKFKEFAQKCGYSCEMIVMSGNGKYHFKFNDEQETEETKIMPLFIDGFLICWKMKIR